MLILLAGSGIELIKILLPRQYALCLVVTCAACSPCAESTASAEAFDKHVAGKG